VTRRAQERLVTTTKYARTVGTVAQLTPRGHYYAWEAGQLAGVSGHTIGQWARRGYIKASQSDGPPPKVYSFQDVAEAMVVHDLLERGVTHADIRRALAVMADYGDWPLSTADLATVKTAKDTRLRIRADGRAYDLSRGVWQQAVDPENLMVIRSQLQRGGWAVRGLPDLEHIEVDPDRLSGRPAIRGRRVAAREVAEIAATADGLETLVEGYGLAPVEINDAQRWWSEVRKLAA
jgi:uncharacterized protein (DUF433 family)/DNA-binding transcriptional MerR regulator